MHGHRTRRQFLAAAGLTCASCAVSPPNNASQHAAHDDFTVVADGPLLGRRSDSGHVWSATASRGDQPPVIYDGAIGAPPGHLPGSSGGADAGYATIDLAATTGRVGADFHWDRSIAVNSVFALGAFTWPATGIGDSAPTAGSIARPRQASMHLVLTPAGLAFSVGAVNEFVNLAPDGANQVFVPFDRVMDRDGHTPHRVDITRRGDVATVLVNDQQPLSYRDPRIAAIPATFPFWEYYSVPGGTNLPRVTRVWADRHH